MVKKIQAKVNHILDRLKFKFRYVVANSIYKSRIDAQNNTFQIMDDKELVDKIIAERKSFARFGDGELSLILEKRFDLDFQGNSDLLCKRLKEVLDSDVDNLIIGIGKSLNDPSEFNSKVERYFRAFNFIYREQFKTIIPLDRVYGNASISRFYIDYDTNDIASAKKRAENVKRIWENREVLVVEGIHSRLGVANDLFGKTKKVRRILVPEKNAFSHYDQILKSVVKNVKRGELVLIAAGPTATVLAYDLAKKGIQAVDIGHVDVEYDWMLMGAKKRVPIKGKYINEIKGKKYEEGLSDDSEYGNSIIDNIQ